MLDHINITHLDIPKNDVDCWEKYPKYRWVYELTRLLDAQNISWSPYYTPTLTSWKQTLEFQATQGEMTYPGHVFIEPPSGDTMLTEVYINKGEIKLIRHVNPVTGIELQSNIGEIELRINAFVTLYFKKFTGVITAKTISNNIYAIQLRPILSGLTELNPEVIRLKKRLYKRVNA